jgi:hypothetical protein
MPQMLRGVCALDLTHRHALTVALTPGPYGMLRRSVY